MKTRHLDMSALLMVKLGFSVVAQISVMIHFSTYGSNVSCCALFRRCISSKKTIVCLPYCWLVSAFSIIFFRSSFLLLTQERNRKSELVLLDMMWARVVFPDPGLHRKIIDGILFSSKNVWIGIQSQTRCCWPTKSSSVWGRRYELIGSMEVVYN